MHIIPAYDAKQRELDDRAITLIAKRQPMAQDLRAVLGAIRMAGDLERIGDLAKNVAEAPPVQPRPLDQDGLLGLFSADVVGGNVELVPATQADMRGGVFEQRPSLEVVYDEA